MVTGHGHGHGRNMVLLDCVSKGLCKCGFWMDWMDGWMDGWMDDSSITEGAGGAQLGLSDACIATGGGTGRDRGH